MSSLKELVRLMQELEDQLVACMRCGLCQAVCPLFAETGREADVARGKLALLDGLAQEILKNPQGVQDHLTRCLLCGSCAANCPSGVKVLDIFIKARAILAGYLGLSPLKKVIFRGVLRQPDWFNRILAWGARFQGIFVRPVDDLLGSSCARFMSPLLTHRHFKPLAPVPWHLQVPRRDSPPGASNLKVVFFVGCLIDKVFPQVGEAGLAALKHHGVGVYLPAGQGCCGIPALSEGDTQTFRQLVRHNLTLLDDKSTPCDYLVTACATCTSTIKTLWPLMMADASPEEQERVAALAAKTLDISQFLVDKVGVAPAAAGPEDSRIPVTYHDPCSRPTPPMSSRRCSRPTGAAAAAAASISSTMRPRRPSANASGTTSPNRSAGWWPPAAPPACCKSPTCCPRPACGFRSNTRWRSTPRVCKGISHHLGEGPRNFFVSGPCPLSQALTPTP